MMQSTLKHLINMQCSGVTFINNISFGGLDSLFIVTFIHQSLTENFRLVNDFKLSKFKDNSIKT